MPDNKNKKEQAKGKVEGVQESAAQPEPRLQQAPFLHPHMPLGTVTLDHIQRLAALLRTPPPSLARDMQRAGIVLREDCERVVAALSRLDAD